MGFDIGCDSFPVLDHFVPEIRVDIAGLGSVQGSIDLDPLGIVTPEHDSVAGGDTQNHIGAVLAADVQHGVLGQLDDGSRRDLATGGQRLHSVGGDLLGLRGIECGDRHVEGHVHVLAVQGGIDRLVGSMDCRE